MSHQMRQALALVSCNPEQRCNEDIGLQRLKTGKMTAVLLHSASKKSNLSPKPLVHPLKAPCYDHSQSLFYVAIALNAQSSIVTADPA
jgi:hypothetical protein